MKLKLLNVFTWLKSFAVEYPQIFWPLVALTVLTLLVIVIADHIIYEHIDVKVTENRRSRYTSVRKHKKKNTYELHTKSGKWIPLADEHAKNIEHIRERFAKRVKKGHHPKPELILS